MLHPDFLFGPALVQRVFYHLFHILLHMPQFPNLEIRFTEAVEAIRVLSVFSP